MINTTFNVSIGDTPHFALYGTDKTYPLAWTDDSISKPVYNYDCYFTGLAKRMKAIRSDLKTILDESTEKYLGQANKNSRVRNFNIGDRCFVKYHAKVGESSKLAANYEGPFRIKEILGQRSYLVENLATGVSKRAHIDNILSAGGQIVEEQIVSDNNVTSLGTKCQERITRQTPGVRQHCSL